MASSDTASPRSNRGDNGGDEPPPADGLREGLALPYECRNGGCGLCLCSVEHGSVEHRPYQRSALPDALKAQGKALMCCAVPKGDVVIEVDGFVPSETAANSTLTTKQVNPPAIRLRVEMREVIRSGLRVPLAVRFRPPAPSPATER